LVIIGDVDRHIVGELQPAIDDAKRNSTSRYRVLRARSVPLKATEIAIMKLDARALAVSPKHFDQSAHVPPRKPKSRPAPLRIIDKKTVRGPFGRFDVIQCEGAKVGGLV